MCCSFILITSLSKSQSLQFLETDFSSIFKTSKTVGLNKALLGANFSFAIGKNQLNNNVTYTNYTIDYGFDHFENEEALETFNEIKYNLTYTGKVNKSLGYTFGITPTLSSNVKSNLSFKDIYVASYFFVTKQFNKNAFSLGLEYNPLFSRKNPIPVVAYNYSGEKFTYKIGFPETEITYNLNERNLLSAFFKPNGFYSNLSKKITYNTSLIGKANYVSFLSGIQFQRSINEYWSVGLQSGFQTFSKYQLLQKNNKVYEFNTSENFFAGIHIKFNINNTKN